MKPREQGDWGELQALSWLISQGAKVSLPYGHSPDYDLIADVNGTLLRIQVKTTRCFRNRRWELTTCTRGGNQSWSGMVKRLDPKDFDYLFAAVADGRRWLIPARHLGGGSGILLGGPKYADYEVERGTPMPTDDKVPAAF